MSISMKGPFMLRRVSGEITVVIWCLGCQEHHRGSVPLMKFFLTDRMEPIQPEPDKHFGAGVSARTYQTWSVPCHFMESYGSASFFVFLFFCQPKTLVFLILHSILFCLTSIQWTNHCSKCLVYRLALSISYRARWGRLNKGAGFAVFSSVGSEHDPLCLF